MDIISPKIEKDAIDAKEIDDSFKDLMDTSFCNLDEFLEKDKEILFIVNDDQRPTPTAFFLEKIDRYLEKNDKDLRELDIDFLVATGSHSPPSRRELEKIFGKYFDIFEDKIEIHRAQKNSHSKIGRTSRDTPVFVDESIFGYDRILTINSLEPHYFAGYTGGRKSLVPGVCHWKTIEKNHRFALKEKSQALRLRDNPVHLDMVEASKKIIDCLEADLLSINIVYGSDMLFGVCCGDFFSSFNSLTEITKDVFTREINKKYDVVIAEVGEPLNKSLYQSLKGFENGKLAIKENGVLILVSRCQEGVGPGEFYETLRSGNNKGELIKNIEVSYSLGEHKSSNLLKFLEDHELFIVSDLKDEVIKDCFCRPFDELDTALKEANKKFKDASVLKIKEAGNIVPRLV